MVHLNCDDLSKINNAQIVPKNGIKLFNLGIETKIPHIIYECDLKIFVRSKNRGNTNPNPYKCGTHKLTAVTKILYLFNFFSA